MLVFQVLHGQSLNEKPLQPWVITADNGIILSAHCTCMAGCGETCQHVSALCFHLDYCNMCKRTQEKITVTGVPAYWKMPASVKGVTPMPAAEIDFSSVKSRKRKLDQLVNNKAATPQADKTRMKALPPVDVPDEAEMNTLFSALRLTECGHNVLRVLPEYCEEYKANEACATEMPPSLRTLRKEECVGLSLEELQEHCTTIPTITDTECTLLEEKTRMQTKSPAWFMARAGRITASNLHAACTTNPNKPSQSLLKKICYPEKCRFTSEATNWGITNEKNAKEKYFNTIKGDHNNMQIRDSGFHVSPQYAFMGASPDAIVTCECHGSGCVEIKCPSKHRDKRAIDAAADDTFCLEYVNGNLSLKKEHAYFKQCQAQMFLTKKGYCDFVVWTSVDMHVLRLFPDQGFWDECVAKACRLFRLAVLPELVGNWMDQQAVAQVLPVSPLKPNNRSLSLSPIERQGQVEDKAKDPNAELWCTCQDVEYGRMVLCDNENCDIFWFHYKCVNLTRKPRGKWYCPHCSPTQLESGKKRKKPTTD